MPVYMICIIYDTCRDGILMYVGVFGMGARRGGGQE